MSQDQPAAQPNRHYREPDVFTRRVMNPLVTWLTRRGVSVAGSADLGVRGRSSGQMRHTPVNPLPFEGQEYLVAPRGTTQWVRNIRVAGQADLRRGRRVQQIAVVELEDAEKIPVLRAYLKKWAWEVGMFFEGVGADSSDDQLAEIAPRHPIFRITSVS